MATSAADASHRPDAVRRLVVVGYNTIMARSMQFFRPDDSVIFVDEPAAALRRNAAAVLAGMPCCNRLVEWNYLREDAADEFFLRDVLGELPSAILPGGEHATLFAARLAERYGLPNAGLGAAALMHDKARLRRVTAAGGVPNPLSRRASGPADVIDLLSELAGAVIVKPTALQGAAGVSRVHSADEAEAAFRFAVAGDGGEQPPDAPTAGQVLVEQYVAGPEFSVEMLVENGRPVFANVTAKQLFDGLRPVERGHVLPYDADPQIATSLTELTGRVVSATGFRSGFIHCEWIVDHDRPMLVECAGRVPGDGIMALLGIAWGDNLVALYADLMEGQLDHSRLPKQPICRAAVAFACATPGTVVSISGVEAASESDGAILVMPLVQVGDQVHELRSSMDRVAMAIAAGIDLAEATARADAAVGLVTVTTSPDGPAVDSG
jgi:biotin carboxylase